MDYVLVLQWPASSVADFDALVDIETRLDGAVGSEAVVDGHDFGSKEMNIFILTSDPKATFAAVQTAVDGDARWNQLRAASRVQGEDSYTVLWPPGQTVFSIA